jgi:hypothetical protein
VDEVGVCRRPLFEFRRFSKKAYFCRKNPASTLTEEVLVQKAFQWLKKIDLGQLHTEFL